MLRYKFLVQSQSHSPVQLKVFLSLVSFGIEFLMTMFNSSNIIVKGQMFSISIFPEGGAVTSNFTISRTFAIDSGTYVCMAKNRLGNSSAYSTVAVYGKPKL